VHKWRSDWKKVMVLSYSDTYKLFKYFNKMNPIETDAQFAGMLMKTLGPGTYMSIAWRKGRRGFWGFWKGELMDNGFKRLKKEKTQEQKELDNNKREVRKLNNKLNSADKDEKQEISEEINELMEENNLNEELVYEEYKKKHGPTPYLKQTHPVYHFHAYESFGNKQDNEVEVQDIW